LQHIQRQHGAPENTGVDEAMLTIDDIMKRDADAIAEKFLPSTKGGLKKDIVQKKTCAGTPQTTSKNLGDVKMYTQKISSFLMYRLNDNESWRQLVEVLVLISFVIYYTI